MFKAAVIGGGPTGLMAAERLVAAGIQVDLYERMPTVGRKFLLAGKGGLNITHSESADTFLSRYGERQAEISPMLQQFGPHALRQWVHDLGIETFIGSSGRVFPAEMKAAPLLRTWLKRLKKSGVRIHVRHEWQGWNEDGLLHFKTPEGEKLVKVDALLLALGGGSWPKLGSDGGWVRILQERGVAIAPLRPANCGFDVAWSTHFRSRYAGKPVKTVTLSFVDGTGRKFERQGEFVVTETGVEGSLIYAVSALVRDEIGRAGKGIVTLDLAPQLSVKKLTARLNKPRGSNSFANHLRKQAGLKGVRSGLLRELAPEAFGDSARLAGVIKQLPLPLLAARPVAEAISSAGGIKFTDVNQQLMVKSIPGLFCAGEMLDWEAPTGGYLLTACFASGWSVGEGIVSWLQGQA